MPEAGNRFDVLVVGAGPAGIAAACAAAESGARVGVVDDNPGPGGQIWRGLSEHAPTPQAAAWRARLQGAGVTLLSGATVISQPARGMVVAETWNRTLELEFDKLILATGARERFLPFPGWTLPGVMGAGGLQALVKSGLAIAGKRVVIAGSGPLLLAVADYLRKHGARISLIAEQARPRSVRQFAIRLLRHPAKAWQALRLRASLAGAPYRLGMWPVQAGGAEKLECVDLFSAGRKTRVECDYLACGFHLVPNTELAELLGCELKGGYVRVNEMQETSTNGIYCAGEPVGIGGVETAIVEGQIAGYAATGNNARTQSLYGQRSAARKFAELLEQTFALRDELRKLPAADTLVCRCEDVTFERLARHTSWRSAKLQTRCGMGPCQGRVCGPAVEFIFGWKVESTRPPIFPARVESLAGAPASK
ncbi:MAG TPA: FAD/NAD(P)-binding oxidoreductase [Candidatus Acidoferrales bacterium]|nr:FAD/NAD(P)-binding oxidoreductase [Candidatus Acidoferrales bacterium]